jgi:hypothetical protein
MRLSAVQPLHEKKRGSWKGSPIMTLLAKFLLKLPQQAEAQKRPQFMGSGSCFPLTA